MHIVTVIENTARTEVFHAEHGLSLYIETPNHHIIFDTGSSFKTWENFAKLNLDPGSIDTVVVSHGHYDHAGGLLPLADISGKAAIYLQKSAFAPYYHDEKYIGIDPDIAHLHNIHMLIGNHKIDSELFIFTDITGRRCWPESNRKLSIKHSGTLYQDDFRHEQCLSICAEGKRILLSGCAHNGILNILDRYHSLFGYAPDIVVSGFHMMKNGVYSESEIRSIITTARELRDYNTVFYTGHCTGSHAFDLMKPILNEQLQSIHSGEKIL